MKGLKTFSWLTVIGLILVLAATGCRVAGPNAPDDQPVATSTPAGSAKPVYTASAGDGVWVLDLLDGQPIIEKSVVTMRINEDQIEGFDGCNHYQGPIYVGPIEDGTPVAGTPVAGADGVFSLPSFARTEMGCGFIDQADPDAIMDQADAYISALMRGERYRVAGDRLRYWTVRAQPGWYSSVSRRSRDNPSTFAAPRGVSLRRTTWTMTNV